MSSASRRRVRQAGLVALALSSLAYGQDTPSKRDEAIESLLLRIQALQQEVEQLREIPPPAGIQPSTPEDEPSPAPPQPAASWTNRVHFHAYADADFVRNEEAGIPNHFHVGELILFGTSRLTTNLSALAEVAIHTDDAAQAASLPLSIERLLMQYRLNDYLTVAAGEYRTDIGYYPTAYLRGAWFQTALTRPALFTFEEDGGILPLHNVGVTISGKIPSGWLGLQYTVETGNSTTWRASAGATTDVASHRGVNFALAAHPRQVNGLEIGVSSYRDRFLPIPTLDLGRSVWSSHVVYNANRIEFLNEGVVSNIRYDPARAAGVLLGFYSQLGYRVGSNWGPYARVEKISIHGDPFFDPLTHLIPWRSTYTGGVRYDWNESVALKLEAGHEADISQKFLRLAAQIAFAF